MNIASLSAILNGDISNAIVASTPGGIEAQEAAGQSALVASAQLPKDIGGATREQLASLGFRFGADVDELFVRCDLPPGWKKVATDHSMWSELRDAKGQTRASIFYKAAFYDRRARMCFVRRYVIDSYRDGSTIEMRRVDVMGGGIVIKEFGEFDLMDRPAIDLAEARAKAWLHASFPGWENPMAHWD